MSTKWVLIFTLLILLVVASVWLAPVFMAWGLYAYFFQTVQDTTGFPDLVTGAISIWLAIASLLLLPIVASYIFRRRETKKLLIIGGALSVYMLILYFVSQPSEGQLFNTVTGQSMYRVSRDTNGNLEKWPLGHRYHQKTGNPLLELTPELAAEYHRQQELKKKQRREDEISALKFELEVEKTVNRDNAEDFGKLQQSLHQKEREVILLTTDNAAKTEQIAVLHADTHIWEAKIRQAKAEKKETAKQVLSCRFENGKLSTQIQTLKTQLKEIKKLANEQGRKINTLTIENAGLTRELTNAKHSTPSNSSMRQTSRDGFGSLAINREQNSSQPEVSDACKNGNLGACTNIPPILNGSALIIQVHFPSNLQQKVKSYCRAFDAPFAVSQTLNQGGWSQPIAKLLIQDRYGNLSTTISVPSNKFLPYGSTLVELSLCNTVIRETGVIKNP